MELIELDRLKLLRGILLSYIKNIILLSFLIFLSCDKDGTIADKGNPNGSTRNIAGTNLHLFYRNFPGNRFGRFASPHSILQTSDSNT